MIIFNKWYPQHIGRSFFETYEKIYHDRVEAKKAGDKQKSNSLKLVLNSTFGLTGSRFSKLYAPDLMLAVTLTGQLQLLDLIEKFERKGIRVVSANTDGISVQGDLGKMRKIYRKWEKRTEMEMEETHYKTLAMESVNSYVAVLTDGTVKAKGDYAEPGLNKNPEYPIVYEAVREYLAHDTPIEDTIRNCKDIRKFLTVRTVNGGAVYYEDDGTIPFVEGMTAAQVRETYGITMAEIKRREKARAERVVEGAGTHLGRVVRWVYTTKDCGTIHYAKNGNKVPNSDRCRPFQVLPKKNKTPKDLDYDRYIRIAFKKLKLVGSF
jgi:DNA polymerase elongation subunit (family B)